MAVAKCMMARSDQATVIQLTECDIPKAFLSAPIDRHTMPELRWWLLETFSQIVGKVFLLKVGIRELSFPDVPATVTMSDTFAVLTNTDL